MFNGAKTSNHVSSGDAYNSESDGEENYKQYHIHGRVGNRFSDNSDYLEEFARNNPSKIYDIRQMLERQAYYYFKKKDELI